MYDSASFDCERVDFVLEEHRHLPGDLFRDGVLHSAGVRRGVVSR